MTGNQIRKNQLRIDVQKNKIASKSNELKFDEIRSRAWDSKQQLKEQKRHNRAMEANASEANWMQDDKNRRDAKLREKEIQNKKDEIEYKNATEKAKVIIQEKEAMSKDQNAREDRELKRTGMVMDAVDSLINGIIGATTGIPGMIYTQQKITNMHYKNQELENKLIGGN